MFECAENNLNQAFRRGRLPLFLQESVKVKN
jgi:hypothetical protein